MLTHRILHKLAYPKAKLSLHAPDFSYILLKEKQHLYTTCFSLVICSTAKQNKTKKTLYPTLTVLEKVPSKLSQSEPKSNARATQIIML
jgi:hypothetical protein